MMDTVQPEKQKKTNDPKQQGKEKAYGHKIMLDKVQPEQQEKKMIRNNQENRKYTGKI